MFFRRKKQEPATTKATGSAVGYQPHAGNAQDLADSSDDTRSLLSSVHKHRYPGANQDLVNAVISSDLDPAGYAHIHDLLDVISEGRNCLIITNNDLISAIDKLRNH